MQVTPHHNQPLTPREVLKKYWGYDAFRPMQEDVVNSVLAGVDTLALMPTGGGKSICYQVPALLTNGLCLVISPLIALMKDQVENLRRRQITAFAIYSGMSRKEVVQTLEVAADSNCRFLYVSPERLETFLFKEWLPALGVRLIAVDEAHCISQWGYDFRPPYLRIAALRAELPGLPVLALTATATREVQDDICRRLSIPTPDNDGIQNWKIFRQSFERPNLSYSNFSEDVKITRIQEILQKTNGTGIVYCRSRRRTKEIAELLTLHGIAADYYHAGLAQDERSRKQEDWIQNKTRVIVCTNAFGMGIDKPDVRIVIHADVPDCLENYYQEAGRAGRDGKRSYAVLLYQENELESLRDSVDTRYPSLEKIRDIYQAVHNYLQVPTGAGAGESFRFEITEFAKKFERSAQLTLHALQALAQDGWLSFQENAFTPSKVAFNCTKEYLYQFEIDYPELEPVIKALLRAYEGIFDQACTITESNIAYLTRLDEAVVRRQLVRLHQMQVIIYESRNEDPQINLLRSRVPAAELHFKMEDYLRRKEKYRTRVEKMIAYTLNTEDCRSQLTAVYFGDESTRACSICDNCLRKKKEMQSVVSLASLREQLMHLLGQKAWNAVDLRAKAGLPEEAIFWKVMEQLQAEDLIISDHAGHFRKK